MPAVLHASRTELEARSRSRERAIPCFRKALTPLCELPSLTKAEEENNSDYIFDPH